jgi:hypothetical protein
MTDDTRFDAAFDDDAMARMEKIAAGAEIGIKRRLALVACARDSGELRGLADDAEMHQRILESVRTWREHCEGLLAIAKAAEARLLAVRPRLRVVD